MISLSNNYETGFRNSYFEFFGRKISTEFKIIFYKVLIKKKQFRVKTVKYVNGMYYTEFCLVLVRKRNYLSFL